MCMAKYSQHCKKNMGYIFNTLLYKRKKYMNEEYGVYSKSISIWFNMKSSYL